MKSAVLKKLGSISTRLSNLREEIEFLRDEEDTRLGDMSEEYQEGEAGQDAQADIDTLGHVLDSLEEGIATLETLTAEA